MLEHVLAHHLVVESVRVLEGCIIVDFAFARLDNECPLGVDDVGDGVVLHVNLTCLALPVEDSLRVPGGLLLVHEAARGGLVLLHFALVVELSHDFVEVVHLQVIATDCVVTLSHGAFLGKQSVELVLNGGYLTFEILVAEHGGS